MQSLIGAKPALRDIERIDIWLTENAGPAVAADSIARILERSNLVRTYPASGPVHGSGLRKTRVSGTPYLLIYRIAAERIEILRVRHDRENWRMS